MQNVLHFHNPDGTLTLPQVADDCIANWIGPLKTQQDDNGIYTSIGVRNIDDMTSSPYVRTIAIQGGADHGDQQVPYMCMVLKLRTAIAGRRGRGRVYVAGLATAHTANGVLSSGGLALWENPLCLPAIRNAYLAGGSSDLGLVVYHRDTRDHSFVTEILPRSVPGVQRRRNIGVGI